MNEDLKERASAARKISSGSVLKGVFQYTRSFVDVPWSNEKLSVIVS